MATSFTIEYLTDHPEAIPIIARWHLTQWHNILPDHTLSSYQLYLSTHYKRGGIPTMFVASRDGRVIATAALEDDEMETHPELTPWLASLYTNPDYRHQGVGESLVKRVIEEARTNQVKKLYLFTPDRQHYHARFGFREFFQENYYGEMESVMVLEISPQRPSR